MLLNDLLFQTYIVCRLGEKVDTLWSFVKNYLKSKIVIFFATCKQVANRHCWTVLVFYVYYLYMRRIIIVH